MSRDIGASPLFLFAQDAGIKRPVNRNPAAHNRGSSWQSLLFGR
ncbi:MAG: hypothetical protein AB2L13_03300 [Spirochaetota bacterium]|jgi:hypothetical protein